MKMNYAKFLFLLKKINFFNDFVNEEVPSIYDERVQLL